MLIINYGRLHVTLLFSTALFTLPKLPSAQSQADLSSVFNQSLPLLFDGVDSSLGSRSAYASTYLLWAPLGFPVALGLSNPPMPLVVAVQLQSSSRIIAIGHEGIVGSCCNNSDGRDRLVLNSFKWLAAAKTPDTSTIRLAAPSAGWSSPALTYIAQALQASSPTPINVTVDTRANLTAIAAGNWSNVDILCIDTYTSYTSQQIEGIIKFANQTGKGLLVAGHAWYWGYTHPGANIFVDLSVNRILWPLGLAVTTDAQNSFQAVPASPPASWLYYNSYYVLSSLVAAKNGGPPFPPTGNLSAVLDSLQRFINFLPARANSTLSGLDGAWSLLDALSGSKVAIGPNNPLNVSTANTSTVLSVLLDAMAIRRSDVFNLTASPSAALYPGAVSDTVPRVTIALTFNASYFPPPYHFGYGGYPSNLWRSTGCYAAPGQLVTVTFANSSVAGKGLQVQVGQHTDDLTSKPIWYRMPYMVSRFPVNSVNVTAGNPMGGLVYILVPPSTSLGEQQVVIDGCIRAPWFRLGVDSPADWAATIRSYPAPWAELESSKFIIMLPSQAIRNLTDPTPALNHWNTVLDAMADLASMSRERARAERFLVDAQIGGGWMHSGYPIMAYDVTSVYNELLDVTYLKAHGAWGPYHELGHNHQWSEMQFSGTTESFVNLFTVYALESTGVPQTGWENWGAVSPAGRAANRATYLASGAKWSTDWSVWVALDTYLQLRDGFGWDLYKNMYTTYQNFNYSALPDSDNVQLFIQTSSAVAGYNLVPFFKAWNFPITDKTTNVTSSLPVWTANPMSNSTNTSASVPPSPPPKSSPPPSSAPPSPPPPPRPTNTSNATGSSNATVPSSSSPPPPPPSQPLPSSPPPPPLPVGFCRNTDAACAACSSTPNVSDVTACRTCVGTMRYQQNANPYLCHECARYGATDPAVQGVCMTECVPTAVATGTSWACSVICANALNVMDDPVLARGCAGCVNSTTDGWACARCIEATRCQADWRQARQDCFDCVASGVDGVICANCAQLGDSAARAACMSCTNVARNAYPANGISTSASG